MPDALVLLTSLAAAAGLGAASPQARAGAIAPMASCANLVGARLAGGKVDVAELVPAGMFTPSSAGAQARPLEVPAFCRVSLTLSPSVDSDIKSEVWLPTNWNGKFMMVGNGAWAGSIAYTAMAAPLSRGYAVASTDTGHRGGGGDFAFGRPELWTDFGWRAVHETAIKAKSLVGTYYGAGPRFSYWNGCSTGGKQGLKEVQAFPDDFDGVIAGAPAHNWTRLETRLLWTSLLNLPREGGMVLDVPDYELLYKSVLAVCDTLDGVEDAEIADPRACNFKPSTLLCRDSVVRGRCLSAAQVEVAERTYSGLRDLSNRLIYPGVSIGSERGWAAVGGQIWAIGQDQYRFYAHQDPSWDPRSLDIDRDIPKMLAFDKQINDATNPDIFAFRRRGGKIIQFHGWSDPLISPADSVNYYEEVIAKQGGDRVTQEFYRLFMVPSMAHCGGGYAVDWITAIENWVEKGEAPDFVLGQRIVATRPGQDSQSTPVLTGARPICAYPAVSHYKGSGSTEDPSNFVCRAAPRSPSRKDTSS